MTTTRGTRRAVLVAALALAAIVVPWAGTAAQGATPQPAAAEPSGPRELILATTTSTQDTGLLDDLIPMFERASGYQVKTIAVGSGQAMALGQRGEADVLLVHSPAAEATFMADGYGTDRRTVMYNDFVLIGPASDPAGIKGDASATAAMAKIARAQAPFVSRGDDSGTNALELWVDVVWSKERPLGLGARRFIEMMRAVRPGAAGAASHLGANWNSSVRASVHIVHLQRREGLLQPALERLPLRRIPRRARCRP